MSAKAEDPEDQQLPGAQKHSSLPLLLSVCETLSAPLGALSAYFLSWPPSILLLDHYVNEKPGLDLRQRPHPLLRDASAKQLEKRSRRWRADCQDETKNEGKKRLACTKKLQSTVPIERIFQNATRDLASRADTDTLEFCRSSKPTRPAATSRNASKAGFFEKNESQISHKENKHRKKGARCQEAAHWPGHLLWIS